MISHAEVRAIALGFPGVEEGLRYGTPAFHVRKKLLARFHPDNESLVLTMDFDTREFVLRQHPEVFYLTDHYRDYEYVLVRLEAATCDQIREYIENSWRKFAPKRLVSEYDSR